ncbi:ubiquitin-conjugating enzyme [Hamiltosporidium tvaerminnensis]|uniref:Ubiquitin-conjugating enzyme n=2 Tax=Hamiltosporidium TaxID=1176354 RepID=A0A4Q9LAQ8_9MICR|nr:hypothetical protein LUQ84_001055 [Hamiltosporidium tvaerminnensis]TBU01152.1 ubiquitin-conjugating enzyme [Hamiltosporidium tvaerminnensis]TBU04556.1 ubiquitin-conjugating enzyme [Hamiltosporidium magnivora]
MFSSYRLTKELKNIDLPPNTSLKLNKEEETTTSLFTDILIFKMYISTGLYRNRNLTFKIKIPVEYPFKGPKVFCMDKIYHPNIDFDGNVCINILRDDWTSALGVQIVLYGIILLFDTVTHENALNTEVGDMMVNNYTEFERLARVYK